MACVDGHMGVQTEGAAHHPNVSKEREVKKTNNSRRIITFCASWIQMKAVLLKSGVCKFPDDSLFELMFNCSHTYGSITKMERGRKISPSNFRHGNNAGIFDTGVTLQRL